MKDCLLVVQSHAIKYNANYEYPTNEDSGEPVQLWLTNTLKKQGIFLTREEAYELRNTLTRTLDNT